ncbi:guanylate binding protein 1 [Silurus meridionalis]|nr:guanylate binding protein 1 [Silurus meridionalis]
MCSPMQEPVCLVENLNGSLCVNTEAIEYLSKNNQPVVVVSVVGLYRTGKSYLLNRLAGKKTGFALGSTIESKTKGIWMWCVQHPYNAKQTLVLLDTEGLGDVDKSFSSAYCSYVTELAEQIKIRSPASGEAEEEDEEFQFVQFFPNFIWAVRDFSLELFIEKKGQVTEDEYLDFALQLKKGFGHLVQSYVNTISSGNVPCLENAVVAMAMIENQAALEQGIKLYKCEMEQVKSLFPISLSDLSAKHQEISNMATTEFMKHSFKDEKQEYFKKLMEAVDKHYTDLIVQNMEASEQKCEKILSDLYEQMNVHMKNKEYAKPGGYDIYCKHRDNIINQYRMQPNKGIQAEEVLERFLNEKSAEAKLILQTDEQLTENEKKIQAFSYR